MTDETTATERAVPEQVPEGDPRELPEDAVLAAIVGPSASATWSVGDAEWVVQVDSTEYHDLAAAALREQFETFIDLCAVDYYRRDPRFEVVLTLLNYALPMRLRVRTGVAGPEPTISSVSDVYPGANFYEREAYDMFGITFTGHPDLTRILMPDEWEGFPLRKDYAVGSVPVQFKDSHKAQ